MIKKKIKQNRTISMIQYKRDLEQAKKESEYLSEKLTSHIDFTRKLEKTIEAKNETLRMCNQFMKIISSLLENRK